MQKKNFFFGGKVSESRWEENANFKALSEGKEMEIRHDQNRQVLQNILPAHVAEYFLKDDSSQRYNYLDL